MHYHNTYTTNGLYWTELVYNTRRRAGLDWKPFKVIVFAYHTDLDRDPDYASWVPTYVTAPYDTAE